LAALERKSYMNSVALANEAVATERVSVDPKRLSRLSHPSDAAELRWYFSSGGLGMFQASTMGSMLERASMFAFGGNDCEQCGGCGFVPSNPKKWREATDWQRQMLEFVGIAEKDLLPPLADRVCGDCQGLGWIPRESRANARSPLTARLTGSSKRGGGGGVDVGHVNIARLGAVSSRLSAIDPRHAVILEAYYGPAGGALVALYAFTPAGHKLLRKNPQKLQPRQLIENEVAEELKRSEPQRKSLLAAAEEQASELHGEACTAWVSSKRRPSHEEARRRALELLDGGA
jgi:hypothetical protein